MSDYVESGWGFLNDSPGSSSEISNDSSGSSNDSSGSYAHGDNVSGVDFSIPSSAPAPVVPTSTPEMTTGFGSVFGASSGSTGSSPIVQDALSDMIDQNVQAIIDQQGYVQHSDLQDAINAAYNNFYPQLVDPQTGESMQMTLEEFIAAGGTEQDYLAANASMYPGSANLMGIPPGQTSVGQEWINDWYAGNTGGSSGGPGPHYGGSWNYGGGRGGGGGGGYQPQGSYGDAYMRGRWGPSHIQRKWIEQLRNPHGGGYFRGMNRGGIVSLC
jgi:hypothetical protein